MLIAEVSLYPMETSRSDKIIFESLESLSGHDLHYDIGALSTRISGSSEQVWTSLRTMHDQALATGNEVVMVVTLSNTQ